MRYALVAGGLLALASPAAAQSEYNFGGTWEWAEANRNRAESGNTTSLTIYPNTKNGSNFQVHYCYNQNCNDFVATELPGDAMTFRWGGGLFEFKLNRTEQTLEGTFWSTGKRDDWPSAYTVMRPLG